MAHKIYDKKKLKDLHSKPSTVNSSQEVTVIEITADRLECRSFNFFFYHKFCGPSKKIIHAQHVCVFMERIARYFFWKGSPAKDHFLSGFSIREGHLEMDNQF